MTVVGPSAGPALTLRRELARKSIHIASASVPVAYAAGMPRSMLLALMAAAIVVALAIEMARARSDRARTAFLGTVGPLLREHEHARISGATWMALSYGLSVLMFDAPIAIAAMWAVAFGDASAAIVGRTIGRHRLTAAKSLEGSLACAVITVAGAMLVARLDVVASVIAGVAAAAAELPSRPFDDNMRIAAAVGLSVTLWMLM